MIRFLASIGYTVQKVRPLVYNHREVTEAEKARDQLRQITTKAEGEKHG